jgi:two-component system sensor histidine kinase UhpB
VVPATFEPAPGWANALIRLTHHPRLSWIHTLPILYKVLIANATIVVTGAVVGTTVTYHFSSDHEPLTLSTLIAAFLVIGFPLSVVVNYLVLIAAFRPIEALQRTANAVRMGDMSARTNPSPLTDPQILHLSETFDATLDELARDRREIEALASQVIEAQEQERRRLSRELHDDTAQLLFAQLLKISTVRASASVPTAEVTRELEEMTVQALESVRRLALELRPPALDDLGLSDALADLCQRFADQLGVPVRFEHRGSRAAVPQNVKLVIYRVAQEALTNVAKHAEATRVWVMLDRADTEVTISIRDNGRGIEQTLAQKTNDRGLGLGLFGMEERVALAGGSFRIWRRGLRGTEVFALIPLLNATPASAQPHSRVWPRNPRRSIFAVLPDPRLTQAGESPETGEDRASRPGQDATASVGSGY